MSEISMGNIILETDMVTQKEFYRFMPELKSGDYQPEKEILFPRFPKQTKQEIRDEIFTFLNRKSEFHKLQPVYYKENGSWFVNEKAIGYRVPTQEEKRLIYEKFPALPKQNRAKGLKELGTVLLKHLKAIPVALTDRNV